MSSGRLVKRILGVAVAVGLLAILACGSSDDSTPTAVPTATALPSLPTIAPGDTPLRSFADLVDVLTPRCLYLHLITKPVAENC